MPLHFRILFPALAAVFVNAAAAATVTTGSLATSFTGPASVTINTSTTVTRNLGNLAGLTPGQSIRISFTPASAVAWEGGFAYNDGALTLNWAAEIEINAGGETFSYTDTWTYSVQNAAGGSSGVFGSQSGQAPTTRSFVVPWGTDLSTVSVVLRDQSSISGPGAVFTASEMALSGTLVTTSVPEPSIFILGGLAPVILLRRKRA